VIENLTAGYFDHPVLNKVNVTLREGMVHLLLGSTGSGKTTLALAIAGLIEPRQGSVLIDGVNPASRSFDRRTLQLAFQFPEVQMFESTAEKEIDYGLKNFGFPAAEIAERRRWAAERVGLPAALLPRDPTCLSFGERRRVALASVIALKPTYLILDEPLAGLDWRGRASLVETLRGLRGEGLTTLVLTHESDLVGEIGDAVTVVADGGVSGPMPPEAFLASDDHPGLVPGYASVVRTVMAACGAPAAVPRRPEDAAAQVLSLISGPKGSL
jgi:energy-coupling factor transporter ATP-binding protein EcfA2